MLKKKYYTGLQIHEAIDGVVGDYKKAIEIYRRLAKMETDDGWSYRIERSEE